MPLLSPKEVLNLKLNCLRVPQLKMLASELGISTSGKTAEIIKRILERQPNDESINEFIKQK